MSKFVKLSVFLCLIGLISTDAFCQLQADAFDPPTTLVFQYNDIENPDPGAPGDQIWDFSDLEWQGSTTYVFSDPSTSLFASQFPEATHWLQIDDEDGAFYQIENNEVRILGTYDEDSLEVFTDDWLIAKFPMQINDSWQDNYSDLQYDQGLPGGRGAEADFEVDGQGSLLLPDGVVFNEVLRLKRTYTDVYVGSGGNFETYKEVYLWLAPNRPFPVMRMEYTDQNGFQYTDGQYYSDVANGINQVEEFTFKMYPNPTSNYFEVEVNKGKYQIQVLDAKGKMVYTGKCEVSHCKHELNLSRGTYFVKIQSEGMMECRPLIIE